MKDEITQTESERTLQHFLVLAAAQVKSQIARKEKTQPYCDEIARLRLLEELVKEQISDGTKDSRTSTGAAR